MNFPCLSNSFPPTTTQHFSFNTGSSIPPLSALDRQEFHQLLLNELKNKYIEKAISSEGCKSYHNIYQKAFKTYITSFLDYTKYTYLPSLSQYTIICRKPSINRFKSICNYGFMIFSTLFSAVEQQEGCHIDNPDKIKAMINKVNDIFLRHSLYFYFSWKRPLPIDHFAEQLEVGFLRDIYEILLPDFAEQIFYNKRHQAVESFHYADVGLSICINRKNANEEREQSKSRKRKRSNSI